MPLEKTYPTALPIGDSHQVDIQSPPIQGQAIYIWSHNLKRRI